MIIRAFRSEDEPKLRRLHAESGFDWPFPDLSGALSALVFVNEQDEPVMLLGARALAECFAIVDPAWENPGTKMAALESMYRAMNGELQQKGITEAVAWLPPQVARTFGRRLMRRFGMVENKWKCLVGFVGR